jgi:hypothetical protein
MAALAVLRSVNLYSIFIPDAHVLVVEWSLRISGVDPRVAQQYIFLHIPPSDPSCTSVPLLRKAIASALRLILLFISRSMAFLRPHFLSVLKLTSRFK